MTQSTFIIPNEAGAAFRADVNTGLQALASLSSGATEPATKYAYQLWVDTSTGRLKIRNAANNAWITWGAVASPGLGVPSIVVGSFTRDLSLSTGTQAITGLGFKPRYLTLSASISGGHIWGSVDGRTDGATESCMEIEMSPAPTLFPQSAFLGFVRTAASDYGSINLASFDNDGFTVTWTKGGSPTGTAACKFGAIG